ncbi:MAG: hypothetical protein KAS32_19390 [Candidatus Peribacteraceae bacterium]|nr:hypothetical protein [Candidatus Peribacteraceae bacterium]
MSLKVEIKKRLAHDEGSCQDCRAGYRKYVQSISKIIEHVYILEISKREGEKALWGLVNLRLCKDCMMDFIKQFNKIASLRLMMDLRRDTDG